MFVLWMHPMTLFRSNFLTLLGVIAISLLLGDGANAAASQALTTVSTVIVDGVVLVIGLISVVAFLYIAYAVISKFNDARRGRAEWGEVFIPFLAGAVILVFITWLVGEANTAAQAINA